MKWKTALLLLAAVCSSVFVVSAQTSAPSQRPAVEPAPFVNADAMTGQSPQPRGGYGGLGGGAFFRAPGQQGWPFGQSQEEATLSNQGSDLARQLGSAKSDSDRDKLKTQVSGILDKQFELRQQRHKKEIESLESQVKKLRDLVDKRQENRREIIAKRLDQILQEAQGLGW
jgi:hypothetical protein